MRQGWKDDALEDEEGVPASPQPKPRASLPSLRSPGKRKLPKRQTLASILTTTTGKNSKDEPDPNIPSLFKATVTSKHHVKAWKTRAAQAKRESYTPASPMDTSSSNLLTSHTVHGGSLAGNWVSPRGLRKKKLTGFASPTTCKSGLPPLEQLEGASSPPLSTKWDDTFLSPRTQQKQNLRAKLEQRERESRPAWGATNLKRVPTRDSNDRLRGLEESRHSPAWAAGRDLLLSNLDDTGSPAPPLKTSTRRTLDKLSMTEHSPFRSSTTSQSGMRKSTSFDGEIDEEALFRQELASLALESPKGQTVKPVLAPALMSTLDAGCDDEDSLDSDEDDFAY
jgi:hypothetical protein